MKFSYILPVILCLVSCGGKVDVNKQPAIDVLKREIGEYNLENFHFHLEPGPSELDRFRQKLGRMRG